MIVFDTETTGLPLPGVVSLKAQPRIIDFAAIQLDPYTGDEVNRFEVLIHPECTIPSEITKITGYKDSDFIGAPVFADILSGLAHFFLGETAFLAHNLAFDKTLLRFELERLDAVTAFPWPMKGLCTVQLFIEEFGKRPRMIELYEATLGRKLDQKHTAMADVEALVEIVRARKLYVLGQ